MEYSRNDLPKKAIRSVVAETLGDILEHLNIEQVTIVYSRPKNLKNLLTKAKLHQVPGKEASKYYIGELPEK